ncbi:MAG: hypothetical protein NTW11_02715 [Candidatus Staskawiczbacteria bacterium]|nr:hypothetical protein [Candidatus Staskawiczbacteria bacterium]
MNQENRTCQNCKKDFIIELDDFEFYEKVKVPAPTFCPECRLQRRLSFRNERMLYHRECDLCGKKAITIYHPEGKNVVYCHSCWWSDKWNALSYGREYDFEKPFFEQYRKLSNTVPREGLINANSINCEYTHLAADNKDCYLLFESSNNERCNHCYWMQLSKDCLDCAFVNSSELCYETFVAWNCYKVFFSKECRDCTDSYFLQDCVGLTNCYGCVNLRSKSYCVFNKQYTKEEYSKILEEKKEQIKQGKAADLLKDFKDFALKQINKYAYIQKSVRSTGDRLLNTKNCIYCFDGYDAENCKYGYHVWRDAKEVMDGSTVGRGAELVYESINSGMKNYNVKFGIQDWNGNHDLTYSEACSGSSNLFGCISLHAKEYCILNKQYTKEEYEALVPKIIEQMDAVPYTDKKGRVYKYGEFFPAEISQFGYNETPAFDHFPMDKKQVQEQGFAWKEQEEKNVNIGGDIVGCGHKGKCQDHCTIGFKLIQAEKDFYEKMGLPVPALCPNCRHYYEARMPQ